MDGIRRALVLGCFGLCFMTATAAAVQEVEDRRISPSDRRAFVVSLYREYYDRTPSEAEVQDWVGWLQRGSSYDDVHAAFIGSDEYFARHQRNLTSWLNGVFAAVTNRNPRPDEVRYWTDRLAVLGNDRRKLGKEFLRSYGGGKPPTTVAPPVPSRPSDLPDRLVFTSQLLVQSIEQEFSGLQQRLLKIQANNLVNVTTEAQSKFVNMNRDPVAARIAHRNVETAFAAIDRSLSSVNGGRDSRDLASQISEMIRVLGRSIPTQDIGIGQPVLPNPPTTGGIGPSLFRRLSNGMNRVNSQIADLDYTLTGLARYDYRWRRVTADVEAYAVDLDRFSRGLSERSRLSDVQNDLTALRRTAAGIERTLASLPVDIRVAQGWQEFANSINPVLVDAGLQGGLGGGDVVVPAPTFNRDRAIKAVDEAIAACDALQQGFTPYLIYGSKISQFVSEVKGLRNSLADLRRKITADRGVDELRRDAQALGGMVGRVNERWRDVVSIVGTGNSPLFLRLAQAMPQVYQALE